MKNFRGSGKQIQLAAPAGGVVGGQGYKQGSFVGVVLASAAEGEQFVLMLKGEFTDLKKKAGAAWGVGDKIYFDSATGEFSTDNTKEFAGYAAAAAGAPDVTGAVILK